MTRSVLFKMMAGIAVALAIVSFGWWASKIGLPAQLPDNKTLQLWFDGFGPWGPVAVVGSMTVAIVLSPIPSAPIALAAGAIYGHFWGGVYVLAGSEIGAIAAFALSRFFGRDVVHHWFGDRLTSGLAGSQNVLMWTIFASRLMPFIGFDIISYAAGLTTLSAWRFAVATLAGIVPASFLLAHFGSALVDDASDRLLLVALLLGILVAVPLIFKLVSRHQQD